MICEENPSLTPVGTLNWYSHYENHCGGASQKQNYNTIWSAYANPQYRHHSRDTCMSMLMDIVATFAKKMHQPQCPSNDEWVNKM